MRSRTNEEKGELYPEKGPLKGLKKAFTKIRKNEKLEEDDITPLREFIDEFTTVSIHENTVGKAVAKIAQEVNKHHHTKTCRKNGTTCRFSYPRFPVPETIIVRPCEENDPDLKEQLLVTYREILKNVKDVLEDDDAIKKIMTKYDKQAETKEEHQANIEKRVKDLCEAALVDYDMYLKALSTSKTGYSIIQRRDLDEIYINSYNIEWIRAWNGNMDIQVELDNAKTEFSSSA